MDVLNKIYTVKEELHLFTSDEKLKHLGYGEWVEECDKITFEYRGYDCVIQRIFVQEPYNPAHYFGGHLCGYVKIPTDHVFHGKDDIDEIDCHGGITYNDAKKLHRINGSLPDHWIGFDCAHMGDITPSVEFFKKRHAFKCINKAIQQLRDLHPDCSLMNPLYRNMAYCVNECIGIVDQFISTNCER